METNNMKIIRKRAGYTQEEVADLLNVTKSSISHWESGKVSPSNDKLYALSKLYGVPMESLMSVNSETLTFGKQIKIEPELVAEDEVLIPVVASLRCGFGRSGEAIYKEEKPVPKSYVKRWGKDIVYYEAVGESMMPVIVPGDLLITVPGNAWEDGWIVVVDVNDSDTIKRIYRADDGGINLVPENMRRFQTMHLTPEDMKTYNVAVLGHVVKAIGADL